MEWHIVPNRELRPEDLPEPDAPWDAIFDFALSFNGYKYWGSFEKCAEITNAQLDTTLTELRTCLFFERQRWHHFGDEPDGEDAAYIRGLVEKIRARIASGNLA